MCEHPATSAEFGLTGRAADSATALAYARGSWPNGTPAEQHLLALHLATFMALDDALDRDAPLESPEEEQRTLLPWCAPPGEASASGLAAARAPIRRALTHLECSLLNPHGSQRLVRSARWWRTQAERTVAAAWNESVWRVRNTVPGESPYLAVANQSMGIHWIAGTFLLLDAQPAPDEQFLAATEAVARSLRLSNDLQDPRRERREGKLNLVSLRAHGLVASGYAPAYATRRARRDVRLLLARHVAEARGLLALAAWKASPRIRSGLAGILTVGLSLVPGALVTEADQARVGRLRIQRGQAPRRLT